MLKIKITNFNVNIKIVTMIKTNNDQGNSKRVNRNHQLQHIEQSEKNILVCCKLA